MHVIASFALLAVLVGCAFGGAAARVFIGVVLLVAVGFFALLVGIVIVDINRTPRPASITYYFRDGTQSICYLTAPPTCVGPDGR